MYSVRRQPAVCNALPTARNAQASLPAALPVIAPWLPYPPTTVSVCPQPSCLQVELVWPATLTVSAALRPPALSVYRASLGLLFQPLLELASALQAPFPVRRSQIVLCAMLAVKHVMGLDPRLALNARLQLNSTLTTPASVPRVISLVSMAARYATLPVSLAQPERPVTATLATPKQP